MKIHSFQTMGTNYQFVGISDTLAEEMEHWLHKVNANLSRFSPISELNSLNNSSGKPIICSKTLWEVLELANFYFQETEGIFHPYLGRVLCGLGYDRSFEEINPSQCTLFPAKLPMIKHPLSLNFNKKEAILHPLVSVDLGGIVKGWSAQKISSWAKREGISCGAVDAGGDMVIWGNEDPQGWEVYIENPWSPWVNLVYLRTAKEVGIATSSLFKRQWGAGYHHIIDPRTQKSSNSDLIQVTILSPDLTLAEVYTKVFLILGEEHAIRFIQDKQKQMAYILVKTDGTVILSSNLNDFSSEWHLV
jgi:thiamine biosynthesis lipoprotein